MRVTFRRRHPRGARLDFGITPVTIAFFAASLVAAGCAAGDEGVWPQLGGGRYPPPGSDDSGSDEGDDGSGSTGDGEGVGDGDTGSGGGETAGNDGVSDDNDTGVTSTVSGTADEGNTDVGTTGADTMTSDPADTTGGGMTGATSGDTTGPPATGDTAADPCGNGVKDPGEQCDGADFGGAGCSDYDHIGGSLTCDPDCTVSTANCGPACGGDGDSCFVDTDCCPGLTCDEWFGCQ